MARVRNNIVIKGLSGSLGEQLVIKRDKGGRTIVSAKPEFDPNHVFSDAQKEVHEKFRLATACAKSAKENPMYVEKANGTPRSAYNAAVADWFHAPEILEIDASAWNGAVGQVIRVKAIDDVQVTQVTVVITDNADVVLEQGQALRETDSLWWSYTTTATAPAESRIVVSARDLPGHITKMEWEEE